MFKQFTRNKVKYLAIKRVDGNVHLVDENGNNWGSWRSVESFDDYLNSRGMWIKETLELIPLGKCELSIRPIN